MPADGALLALLRYYGPSYWFTVSRAIWRHAPGPGSPLPDARQPFWGLGRVTMSLSAENRMLSGGVTVDRSGCGSNAIQRALRFVVRLSACCLLPALAEAAGASSGPWAWTEQYPGPSIGGSITYDSLHQQMLVFSGYQGACSAAAGETWVSSNGKWTRKWPLHSPDLRGSSIVYDQLRNQVVLFGGECSGPSGYVNKTDTWTWDGEDWSLKQPLTSPTNRQQPLVYDASRGLVVLSGIGTWGWDGVNWTKLSQDSAPGRMVYDVSSGELLAVTSGTIGTSVYPVYRVRLGSEIQQWHCAGGRGRTLL